MSPRSRCGSTSSEAYMDSGRSGEKLAVLNSCILCSGYLCTAGSDIDSLGRVRKWSRGSKGSRHGVSGDAAIAESYDNARLIL